jgi:hypothetical protein
VLTRLQQAAALARERLQLGDRFDEMPVEDSVVIWI